MNFYFGASAQQHYAAALTAIGHVLPEPLPATPTLTFGGVARYGRLLAYYRPDANVVVVPTDTHSMAIAQIDADADDMIDTRSPDFLVKVLTHELMHAADAQLYRNGGSRVDPHATRGWVTQVIAFERLADASVPDIDVADVVAMLNYAREMKLGHGPIGYLRRFCLRYWPPVDARGAIVTGNTGFAEIYTAAREAFLRRDRKIGKPCAHCGEAFFPKRIDAQFCSTGCRTAAHRALPAEEQARRAAARHAKAVADAKDAVTAALAVIEDARKTDQRLLAQLAELRAAEPARAAALKVAREALEALRAPER